MADTLKGVDPAGAVLQLLIAWCTVVSRARERGMINFLTETLEVLDLMTFQSEDTVLYKLRIKDTITPVLVVKSYWK